MRPDPTRSRRSATAAAPIAVGILLAAVGVVLASDEPRVVLPAQAAWQDVASRRFDPSWSLPSDHRGDAVVGLRALLDSRFPPWRPAAEQPEIRGLGDLLAACRRARTSPAARDALLERYWAARPEAERALRPYVGELVTEERLFTDDWDPDDDEPDDGILLLRAYDLAGSQTAPWSGLEGSTLVHQAAAVFWADLDTIKELENDYTTYPARIGASYELIHAVAGSYLRGVDAAKRPFSTLQVAFRCDLPFPYSDYDCDLRVLNRLDDLGHLVTDIYSTSEDFYWMAGRDVFVPVRTTAGEWIATLVVRQFGFDIRSVPDGAGAKQAALRSGLGNLKRRVDAVFAERGGRPRIVEKQIPTFPVRGVGDPL